MATIENLFKDLYQKSETTRMSANEMELLQKYTSGEVNCFVIKGINVNVEELIIFDTSVTYWNAFFINNMLEKYNPDLTITLTHNDLMVPYVLYNEQICYLYTNKECTNQVDSNTDISPNQTFYFVYNEPQELQEE